MSESGPLSNADHLAAGPTGAIEDQARSVHSPAAYLADLLQLVEDRFERAALLEARRRIKDIPLDAANTFTEVPYLDVVNEVLAENVAVKQGEDAYTTMTGMTALSSPVAMPFSLADLRRRKYLQLAGVAPERLYRQFTPEPDPDVVAREYLGLSREIAELVTTAAEAEADVKAHYRLDGAEFSTLKPVGRFLAVTGLSARELAELLFGRLSARAVDGRGRSERVMASAFFVNQGGPPVGGERRRGHARLGRGSGVGAVAVVRPRPPVRPARPRRRAAVHRPRPRAAQPVRQRPGPRRGPDAWRSSSTWRRRSTLPVDVACSLVAPMETLGLGDGDAPADLFDRTFNGRFAEIERAVVRGSEFVAPAHRRPPGAHLRRRPPRAPQHGVPPPPRPRAGPVRGRPRRGRAPVPAASYRTLRETSPFDEETGLAALSLLHRVSTLTGALGIAPAELFAVLDALNADPSIRGHNTFDLLIDTPAAGARLLPDPRGRHRRGRAVAGADPRRRGPVDAGDGPHRRGAHRDPRRPLRSRADDAAAVALVLDELYQQFQAVLLAPEVFVSDRFGPRSARVVHDVLLGGDGPVSARDPRVVRLDDDPPTPTPRSPPPTPASCASR